eukprot:gene23649-biopygen19353
MELKGSVTRGLAAWCISQAPPRIFQARQGMRQQRLKVSFFGVVVGRWRGRALPQWSSAAERNRCGGGARTHPGSAP